MSLRAACAFSAAGTRTRYRPPAAHWHHNAPSCQLITCVHIYVRLIT